MKWFGWSGRGGLLAAAMIVAVAIGCGGEEKSNAGGSGGAGGGDGGGLPCGGRTCGEGQSCNELTDRCECTSVPDSCAPFGRICNAARVCELPPQPPPDAAEFGPCNAPGQVDADQVFVCMALEGGGAAWARLCQNSGHCALPLTNCLPGVVNQELGVCWFNYCGDEEDENGERWGACDTETGRLSDPETATGICLPEQGQSGLFLCFASGQRELDESCRQGGPRGDPEACAQGLACLGDPQPDAACAGDEDCHASQRCEASTCTPRSCTSDAACGDGNYCLDGHCEPLGRCVELCNSGSLGAEAGPFAGCDLDHPEQPSEMSCTGGIPANAADFEHAISYCMPEGEGGAGGGDGQGGAGGWGGDEGAGGAGGWGGDGGCEGVTCEADERCSEGTCVADLCLYVHCPDNSVCNPVNGACHCMGLEGPICSTGEDCVAAEPDGEGDASGVCVPPDLP